MTVQLRKYGRGKDITVSNHKNRTTNSGVDKLAYFKINGPSPVTASGKLAKPVEVPDHKDIWARPVYKPSNDDSMNRRTSL